MRDLYPPIQPYNTGMLSVSDIHALYYEESGNPNGQPVIFIHGGPGGGCPPIYRQLFHPALWRIVLFDQRGAGKSIPKAELRENTTWDLVADIERIREHLGIEKWVVFGGSWGSTLSLAYSETHPERCLGLILRGIFMLRQKEIQWFYQYGASEIFPEAWADFLKPIPPEERHDLVSAYHKRLTSGDRRIRLEAAKAWSIWEGSTSKLVPSPSSKTNFARPSFAEAFARIECHYFVNKGFFDHEDQLLRNIDRIRHLPGVIVQGRYDVVCPITTAWDLHKAWPEAEFIVLPTAGHSAFEDGIRTELLNATDRFAKLGK